MSTTYGDWLKFERAARRLSQAAVERAAGVSHSHYSKLENNKIPRPQEDTREKLHRVFGTTDDDLVAAGVMEKRPLQQPGTGREVEIYEYVDDVLVDAVEFNGTRIPASIAALLQQIEWTDENIETLTPLLKHVVRSDTRDVIAPPAPTPPAARAQGRGRRVP